MLPETGINGFNLFIAITLILSHLITDFVLQPTSWVDKKRELGVKTKYFWYHVIISALVPYVLIHQWDLWIVPVTIFVTHTVIDYWKISREKKIDQLNSSSDLQKPKGHLFIIDQLLHLFVLIGLAIYINDINVLKQLEQLWCENRLTVLIMLTSVLFLLSPSGILIGSLTEQFRKELKDNDSLKKAGMFIGAFERLLVFAFILLNQYGGIGFLLASKSILRIARDGENDGRKKTEYVLIGTLISFSIAILVGLVIDYLLEKV